MSNEIRPPAVIAAVPFVITVLSGCAGPSIAASDAQFESKRPAHSTGTMHYAERTRIAIDGASLELSTSVERGELAPIIEKHWALAALDLHLFVGRSSFGGGMQTVEALLVRGRDGKVEIVDRLVFTGDRAHAHLMLSPSGQPSKVGAYVPSSEVHSASDWSVKTKSAKLDYEGMKAAATTLESKTRGVWFDITRDGFTRAA